MFVSGYPGRASIWTYVRLHISIFIWMSLTNKWLIYPYFDLTIIILCLFMFEYSSFDGKLHFSGFDEKLQFFLVLVRNSVFPVLAEKFIFWFLQEIVCFRLCQEIADFFESLHFSVLVDYYVFWFRRKIVFLWFFAENFVFPITEKLFVFFLAGNCGFRFLGEKLRF